MLRESSALELNLLDTNVTTVKIVLLLVIMQRGVEIPCVQDHALRLRRFF